MNALLGFLFQLKSTLRFTDLIDVLIVAVIVYRILLMVQGTRAMQMLTGLGILTIGFFLSSSFELFTTHWVLSHFFDYLVVIVIVLFQDDLRRALSHVGKNPFFSSATIAMENEMLAEVARAAHLLAADHVGALIVIERETGLKNFIDTGSYLDSIVKSELIYSIFTPTSPIHDGAIIISQGKLVSAGCFLPMSKDPNIEKRYGARHRAALGLSEDSDAIIVVVSEESGGINLVKNGKITTNLTENELLDTMRVLFDGKKHATILLPKKLQDWLQQARENLKNKKGDS